MPFTPRTYEVILNDMIAHVRANTGLTDFNVGSIIRTLLESAALEDDEQYFQMVQLLDAFSFQTASDTDLDERVADFNLIRLLPASAVGRIRYRNEALTKSALQFAASSGAISVELADSSDFPTSGYPYDIRVGEGTANVEDIAVSNNDTSTNILTIAALVNSHSIGERVSLITGDVDHLIAAGAQVQVPTSGDEVPIPFEAIEPGTIAAGDYESNLVTVISSNVGASSNVGVNRITQFVSSVPFSGAAVTNPENTSGGRDRETDEELRERAKLVLQGLSRGTPQAIEGAVRGIEDPDTGQRVVTSQLVEDFTTEEHLLYIDDGTGFVPSRVIMARDFLSGAHLQPQSILTMTGSTESFPSSGFVLIKDSSNGFELVEYSSKDDSNQQLNLAASTTIDHNNNDEVVLVDVLPLAEEGQNFFRLNDYPIQRGSFEIYDDSSGSFTLRTSVTDYFLNRTNGELQYVGPGLPAGTQVLGHYTYYTGLFALAQKVINGDKDDPTNFPGVAAAGNIIYVDTPVIRQIDATLSISAAVGFDESALQDLARSAVENYIDARPIGGNVILARIIERVMSIDGVENVNVLVPTGDIIILENELPRSFDSNGNTLVTVF